MPAVPLREGIVSNTFRFYPFENDIRVVLDEFKTQLIYKKGFLKFLNSYKQVANYFNVFTGLDDSADLALDALRRAISTCNRPSPVPYLSKNPPKTSTN